MIKKLIIKNNKISNLKKKKYLSQRGSFIMLSEKIKIA